MQTTVRKPKERRSATTTINRTTRRLISKLNLVTFLGLGFGQKLVWEMGFIPPFQEPLARLMSLVKSYLRIATNCLLYSLMNADIQARETFSTHVRVKNFNLRFEF